ncbi:MAG: APC family permease [Crenarchaeota archaeon]|nr:APC family permease [Thermoproteota archaeon]MDW8033783.1 amino acid permease [Nitrososphaerota archaeon]
MTNSAATTDSSENTFGNKVNRSVEEITLKRALNLAQTTFLGVGTAICGTIFAIMGRAVEAAGPSIVITFLIGAFFALFSCFSYAELGSTVPSSAGGAISFVKRAFGESIPAFLAGWFDWVGSITDCALGAIVFAFSINYFLKWLEPYVLAIIILIVFAFINFRGVKTMGIAEFILTAILVSSLGLYMAGSFLSFNAERFQPLFPKGFLPTMLMVGYIFPTYAGYETITQLSEEVKTAGKTIPRALFLSLIIITIIFTGTAVATIGGAPSEVYVGSNTPLQDAANYFMGPVGVIVVTVGSMIATLSTINGSMAGATRIAYALSRSNLLPSFFKQVHPKYRTPYTSLALTTIVAIAFVLTRSVDFIVYVIALGYNVTAILVALSLMRLRKAEPHLYRPFKVPLYPLPTIMAVLTSIIMILTLSIESLILGMVFGFTGVCILMLLRKTYKDTGAKGD